MRGPRRPVPLPRRSFSRAAIRILGSAVATLALAAATLAVAAPAHASEDYPRSISNTVTLVGRGFGHGHGMSQWGAYGAAVQGISWTQIVDHYYPGTTRTAIGNPAIRVSVAGDLGQVAAIPSATLFATFGANGSQGGARTPITHTDGSPVTAIRAFPVSSTLLQIRYLTTSGTWYAWGPQSTEVRLTDLSTGTVNALGVGAGRVGTIHGELRGTMASGVLVPVAVLPMEEYLRGVVPHESPASWPANALAAQAVAARSYAAYSLAHPRSSLYDICDTTSCQVYQARGFYASTDAAISASSGVAMRYQGQPAFTEFSASTGGWNSQGSQPYLLAQADPWDDTSANPYRSWTVTIPVSSMESNWPGIGSYLGIRVLSRDGAGGWGGRIVSASVYGTAGAVTVSGASLQARFGLKSTYFTVLPSVPDLSVATLSGTSSGHVEVRGASGTSGYTVALPTLATGMVPQNPAQWRYLIGRTNTDQRPDLIGVRTSGTASGRMEVVVSSSSSDYAQNTTYVTPLGAFPADNGFEVTSGKDPNDVCVVMTGTTGSHTVEVHCLSAASHYAAWSLHTSTVIPQGVSTSANRFFVAPVSGDLYWVKHGAGSGSGRAEAHVLTGASGYRSWSLHVALPLGLSADATTGYQLWPTAGRPDLVFLVFSGSGSGRMEVHRLSASSNYSAFTQHTATPLPMSTYPTVQPTFG